LFAIKVKVFSAFTNEVLFFFQRPIFVSSSFIQTRICFLFGRKSAGNTGF